ncbi:photosynthetic reaction center H subunit [Roseibium hamelinense]|uniref:Photosynthetic reaction center H subunit n=1 Tax=Roseibium hamelinense TaxID=150831 RepID=A0A562SXC5_9HYPH|nr:photosynthetic reaction center subunit H [Roseibium hamelinense]MTI44859.1 photosynthetic reaction center subunit H [Roseibium hamelinense]TWI85947.1 photosynthetic reaction center H subunit [Roseibium hamelinense]
MEIGAITQYIDVAQVTLYVFWVFFAILIFYIRLEDRREGYPLEADGSGAFNKDAWLFVPPAKTFLLPHGHGEVSVPDDKRDNRDRPVPGEKIANFEGAPYVPTAENPMLSSIGPGSWAERSDTVDLTHEGAAKIVPMRIDKDWAIAEGDTDPKGMRVVGCDLVVGGTVVDAWIDRSEQMMRYLEIETEVGAAPRRVLVPMNFTVMRNTREREKIFYVHAITGEQFADVPAIASDSQITLLEEDKVTAYYGAGLLYATPARQEPLA